MFSGRRTWHLACKYLVAPQDFLGESDDVRVQVQQLSHGLLAVEPHAIRSGRRAESGEQQFELARVPNGHAVADADVGCPGGHTVDDVGVQREVSLVLRSLLVELEPLQQVRAVVGYHLHHTGRLRCGEK